MTIYTHAERTVKKYTVQFAIDQARIRVGGAPVCVNSVAHLGRSDVITLERLNELTDAIVADTQDSPRW